MMVYKIHGCPLMDNRGSFDNIVISDQDYVRFIQDNGQRNCLVPVYVQNVMGPAALFLGPVPGLERPQPVSEFPQGSAPHPERKAD